MPPSTNWGCSTALDHRKGYVHVFAYLPPKKINTSDLLQSSHTFTHNNKEKTPFQQGKNCQDTNIRAGESSNLRFLSRVWILSLLSMLHFLSMRMWCVCICYINCLSLYVYVKWSKKVESIELLELWKLHGVEKKATFVQNSYSLN